MKDISEEIPFALAQGWAWTRIGAVFYLQAGKNISSQCIKEHSAGYPYPCYGGNGVRGYVKKSSHKGIHAVIGRQGALCGNLNLTHDEFYATEHAVVVETFSEVTADFAYWFLKQMNLNQYATATAQPGLSVREIVDVMFPLPPLAEQKRIVAKIEELFAYVDKIGEASDGITQAAQRLDKKILDLAIRGQLVPQDPNDEPASELIKRIEAAKKATAKGHKSSRIAASDRPAYEIEPPFEIPDSWEWVKLGNLVKIIAGVSYQKDDVTRSGVRILRGGNIKEDANIHLFDDDVFLPLNYANEESTIHSGDIVIVASTGSSTVIGRPAVAKEALPGIQIGAFLRIVRPVVDEVESWMPVLFLGDYYRLHIRGKSKGTNIKNLKAEYLSDLLIPLPPVAEQKRIVAKIKELRAMTRSLTK